MADPLYLKIFLSSPGGVTEERELARHLIKGELPQDPLLRGKVTFDVFSWDDPAAGVTSAGPRPRGILLRRHGQPRPMASPAGPTPPVAGSTHTLMNFSSEGTREVGP
jgi:hypothetical protein